MKGWSQHRSELARANIPLTLARSRLSRRGLARALGHGASHLNDAVKRFGEDDLEGLRERRGSHDWLERRDESLKLLPGLVAKAPSDDGWTRSTSVELVAPEVERQLGTQVSRPHVGRTLAEAKCRRIRPRPMIALTPTDTDKRASALHAELDQMPHTDVIRDEAEDEVGIDPSRAPTGCLPGYASRSLRLARTPKQGVAGAYDPETSDLLTAEGGSKSSDPFIQQAFVAKAEGRIELL